MMTNNQLSDDEKYLAILHILEPSKYGGLHAMLELKVQQKKPLHIDIADIRVLLPDLSPKQLEYFDRYLSFSSRVQFSRPSCAITAPLSILINALYLALVEQDKKEPDQWIP